VEALEHVVNFDVPHLPEDYIHRVGRTARAEATGEAFTLVSPEEENDLKAIEKSISKKLPRRTLEGFNYNHQPVERFEVPIAERIAAIRARKAEERARAKAKLERRQQAESRGGSGGGARSGSAGAPAGGGSRGGSGASRGGSGGAPSGGSSSGAAGGRSGGSGRAGGGKRRGGPRR
jgi:ATP-dependent RNA helicase RhlE